MAGYWDEITGDWVDLGDGESGWDYTDPEAAGYSFGNMDGWTFNNNVWIDPEGKIFDMRYLESASDPNLLSKLVNAFKTKDGSPDWAKIATAGAGLYQMFGGSKDAGGYNKPVPKMEMVRQAVQYDDANRRPGSAGRQYFTDTQFTPAGESAAARDAATAQAAGLKALQPAAQPQTNPYAGKMPITWNPASNATTAAPTGSAPANRMMIPSAQDAINTNRISEIPYKPGRPNEAQNYGPGISSLIEMPSAPGSDKQFVPYRPPLAEDASGSKFGSNQHPFAPTRSYSNPDTMVPTDPGSMAEFGQDRSMSNIDNALKQAQMQTPANLTQNMAHGGLAHLAAGGRYLDGATDGMADEINTTIDGEQPAKLSHGEFVIPADVVSHLGNGNSDAGAKKLYEMMARVRKARTGNEEQGRQINPDSFMPGGKVGYASGGAVRFDAGGGVGNTGTTQTSSGTPLDTSRTSTLSPWVGDYVTNALGQGAALANAPYQAYTGPLSAGASDLQQQAFAGSSELAQAGYQPTQFQGGLFDLAAANQYMNPYLQASLDPQLKELQRQNQILNMEAAGKAARSGAYGGSRQALVQTENQRNLLDKMSNVIGQGYNTAYDKAAAQFNADQARLMDAQKATEASRQYGADFGLKSLSNLATMGQTQRDIEREGIAADKAQFEEQRDWAYKMPQYQLNLLSNLPIGAQTTSSDQTGLAKIMSDISGLGSMYKTIEDSLKKLGVTNTTPAAP